MLTWVGLAAQRALRLLQESFYASDSWRSSSGHTGVGPAPAGLQQHLGALSHTLIVLIKPCCHPMGKGSKNEHCCQIRVLFCLYQSCLLKLTHLLSRPSLLWDTKWNVQRTNPTESEFISLSFCLSFAGYFKQVNSWRFSTASPFGGEHSGCSGTLISRGTATFQQRLRVPDALFVFV